MSGNPTPSATLFSTFAVSGQMSMPAGNLARSGPVDQAMFFFWADVSISYQLVTGGPTYTDTVHGLTPATVYGTTKTTVDARAARSVIFIEPQRGGVAPPRVAPEAYYNYLAQQGYVIPLFYATWDQWTIYQNTAGIALPPPGGSFSGGLLYGLIAGHSFSGGLRVSTLTYHQSTQQGGADPQSKWGFFLKVPAAPASDTALVDLNGGASGYLRIKLTAALHIVAEYNMMGQSGAVDLGGGAAISPNQWYYVTLSNTAGAANFQWNVAGQIILPGLIAFAPVQASPTYGWSQSGHSYAISGQFGLGVATSSGWSAFPNQGGWMMSKFYQETSGSAGLYLLGMPVTDYPVGQGDINYACRDGIGPVNSLHDYSANNITGAAASQGLTVNVEGPYA